MFAAALARGGAPPPRRRIFRETWAFGPHLYAVNAREDLVDNVCRALAEGIPGSRGPRCRRGARVIALRAGSVAVGSRS